MEKTEDPEVTPPKGDVAMEDVQVDTVRQLFGLTPGGGEKGGMGRGTSPRGRSDTPGGQTRRSTTPDKAAGPWNLAPELSGRLRLAGDVPVIRTGETVEVGWPMLGEETWELIRQETGIHFTVLSLIGTE